MNLFSCTFLPKWTLDNLWQNFLLGWEGWFVIRKSWSLKLINMPFVFNCKVHCLENICCLNTHNIFMYVLHLCECRCILMWLMLLCKKHSYIANYCSGNICMPFNNNVARWIRVYPDKRKKWISFSCWDQHELACSQDEFHWDFDTRASFLLLRVPWRHSRNRLSKMSLILVTLSRFSHFTKADTPLCCLYSHKLVR